MENFKKYLVEFIGTFFLMLTVGLIASLPLDGVIGAVVIGFVLMVMVYAGGYISGGHYNPAVSLAAAIRGAISAKHCFFYMISQIIAAILASYLVIYLAGAPEGAAQAPFPISHLIIGEFLFTFALCYVVLTTATSSETEGNSYYGLAIGSTVLVGASVAGGVLCYGAFNPAVAIGLLTLNIACVKTIAITILVNLLAGAVAAGTYKLLDNE